MIVGVLGAIAQNDMKRILSFHIVSQIGYMVLGLGLFTVSGLAGTVFFIIHQIPVKTSLFLVSGLVEESAGSTALDRVGGLLRRAPVAAALFGVAALSLAGIPPFSGFVGKLSLVEAGFGAGAYVIVGVSLVGSILTLFSMAKIWNGVFWGAPDQPTAAMADGTHRLRVPAMMTTATVALGGRHRGHCPLRRADLRPQPPGRGGSHRSERLHHDGAGVMSTRVRRGGVPIWTIVARVATLVVIWVALWGTPTVANFISGILVVAVITFLFPAGPGRLAPEHEGTFRPVAALHYLVFFAWALVVATWDVAVTVLRPRSKVAEAVVAVPLRSRSPVIATMVANSITLTPGTMTIDVSDGDDPVVLFVHVLGLADPQSIRDDGLDFERLAVEAFGSPDDRERWARAEAADSEGAG